MNSTGLDDMPDNRTFAVPSSLQARAESARFEQMKPSHVVFNGIGLFIGCMCLVSMLSVIFILMPTVPLAKRGLWYFFISWDTVILLLLAIGSIANFAKGRLSDWPTSLMIAAYFISVWLIPLGLWGIVALLSEQKRRRTQKTNNENPPPIP